MMKILHDQRVKKIGFMTEIAKGDLDLRNRLIAAVRSAGIEVVFNEETQIGNKDFKMFFAKIKNKPVDIIYTSMVPEDFYAFIKQKKEVGYNAPLTTVDFFESIDQKELVEGSYYVMSSSGGDKFLEQVKTDVVGQCVGNVHDGIDLIITAFETADAAPDEIPTTAAVAHAMNNLNGFIGVLGKITVDSSGHIDSPAYIKQIRNGKPEVLK
jgi:ABC-type branched-subunit amino acid transport system substrate-binding protein